MKNKAKCVFLKLCLTLCGINNYASEVMSMPAALSDVLKNKNANIDKLLEIFEHHSLIEKIEKNNLILNQGPVMGLVDSAFAGTIIYSLDNKNSFYCFTDLVGTRTKKSKYFISGVLMYNDNVVFGKKWSKNNRYNVVKIDSSVYAMSHEDEEKGGFKLIKSNTSNNNTLWSILKYDGTLVGAFFSESNLCDITSDGCNVEVVGDLGDIDNNVISIMKNILFLYHSEAMLQVRGRYDEYVKAKKLDYISRKQFVDRLR